MMRPLLIAYLLAVSACAARPAEAPVPTDTTPPCEAPACAPRVFCLSISGDFTSAQREAILDTAAEWRLALGSAIDFSCTEGDPEDVTLARDFVWRCGAATGTLVGCTAGDYVTIDPTLNESEFHEVVAHELGHVLGLGHAPRGVMRESISGEHRPGRYEARAFQALKGCCL